MQCPNCHKTGFVIIGNKRYCSNCGSRLSAGEAPRGMSDIKPNQVPAVTPAATPSPVAATPAAVTPTAATVPPTPTPLAPPASAKPAVLDLRVQKPISTPKATPSQPPTPPVTPTLGAQPASAATHPLVKRFPEHPAVAKAAPDPLPNQAASQLEALQALTPIEPATTAPATAAATTAIGGPSSPALQQVMASAKSTKTPSVLKIGAALAAIAIMSGVVWLQNSPKLAFRSAASQAGIDASLPSYIPSSYRQSGPASVAAGQLTLAFNSPGAERPLQITQRRTNWDSSSLRENYVARQSDNYLAVQGQGLTIYVLSDSVNWVNRGIWYTVSGTAKLSREQVLKIAYGL